jgi:uncharacterized delta-60 repeat protein
MRKVFYSLALVFSSVFSNAQIGSAGGGGFLPIFSCNSDCADIAVPGTVSVKGMRFTSDGNSSYVFGGFTEQAGNKDFFAVSMMQNGRGMPLFDGDGVVITDLGDADDEAWGGCVQPDYNVVLAGFSGNDFALVRYDHVTAALDNTFGGGTGIVKTDLGGGSVDKGLCMALQPDGKILVAGYTDDAGTEDFAVVRYNSNGTIDNTFGGGDGIVITDIGTNTVDVAFAIRVQPDGKILVAGTSGNGTTFDVALVRYNANGTLDTSFDFDGKQRTNIGAVDIATKVDLEGTGKVVVGGYTGTGSYPGTNRKFLVIRYGTNGALDPTLDGDGIVTSTFAGVTDAPAYGLAVTLNGRILMAGTNDGSDVLVAQYKNDGSLDTEFDTDGWNTFNIGNANEVNVANDILTVDQGPGVQGIYFVGANANNAVGITSVIGSILTNLPLNLLSFDAQKQSNNILLQWQTEREQNFAGFDIQRSSDGKNFRNLGYTQPMTTNGTLKKNYSYVDMSPLSAVNYYRLAMKDLDGSVTYSKILAIRNNNTSQNLEVFPNPLPVGGVLQIQLPSGLRGRTNLQISDVVGRVVRSMTIETNGNSMATSIDLGSLGKGVYTIRARADNNVSITTRFIKN